MGHTYTSLWAHGVFSTKGRLPILTPELMPGLVRVIGGVIRQREGKLVALNGTENHVHLLAMFHPAYATSDMFRDIKAISCAWIHESAPDQRKFAWQTGYGAFSVSKSRAGEVESYIAGQQEHHRKRTFEEEFIAILKKHDIEYDPRYVFDAGSLVG